MDLTTSDTARMLGVTDAEVRRLIRAGHLVGRRLGPVWLVDAADVQRRLQLTIRPGRTWSPRVALAAVLLLSGDSATGLSEPEASRLRKSLLGAHATDVLRRARQLVSVEHWRVPSSALDQFRSDPRVFVTHLSAIATITDDLSAGSDHLLHIGIAASDLSAVREAVRARDAVESANVTVYVIRADISGSVARLEVQRVITALVLGTHDDARVRTAAMRFIDLRVAALSSADPI